MAIGYLYNKKEGFAYPKGKLFDDQDEYDEALESGWNTGPADAAKAKKVKVEEEESKEEEKPISPTEDGKPRLKPKPKTRRRKK